MASLASKARSRIIARRLSANLDGRFEPHAQTVAGIAAGRNLASVGGRLVAAEGLDDYAPGAPVTLNNVGSPGMAVYAPAGSNLAVQFVGGGASSGGGGGEGGVTDHGALSGLGDDDHPQYLTAGRGDVRYVTAARQITAGAGLTGGGDLSADRTLAVGAGEGISVAADTVGLASSVAGAGLGYAAGVLSINPGEGLEIETDAIGLASSVAGAGLAYAAGVLNVGEGAGLTVAANTVALTTPGTLAVASTNSATGNHTHGITTDSDPNATAAILATTGAGLLTLRNLAMRLAVQSQVTFASGFAGSGWRIDYGLTETGKASAEFDNLTIRGRMRVYELLIQQIRATNGSLFVSSASRVVSVTSEANPLWLVNGSQLTLGGANANFSATIYQVATAEAGDTGRELYHGFLPGDIIRAQRVEWDGSTYDIVLQSNLEVTGVTDLFHYQATMVSGGAPAPEYDYVRLGSSSDTTRRGAIYLTADDSNAPFIDIVDEIASHADWNTAGKVKTRVGKLTGISDVDFGGPLDGYGLYASRAFIKGRIVVTSGSLGGLAAADINQNTTTIDGGKITANSVTAAQIAAGTITTTEINFVPVLTGNVVASINATAEGLKIAANLIQIDGTTTFSAGYNPTTKIGSGGAAADVNANVTTISGGKITTGSITALQITASTITADKLNITSLSAITANLGTVTAGSLVIGSTNKLWLNDSSDGQLAIGGSTKSAAPFLVSAAGHLDAIDATFGTLKIDTTGAYVTTQNTFSMASGYKFRYNATNGGGLLARWVESSSANIWLMNNKNALTDTFVDGSADSTITVLGTASSAKSSAIDLRAERIVSGAAKFTGLSLLNTSSARKATIHADTLVIAPEAGGEYAIWHSNNDGPGSGLNADTVDGKEAADFAWINGSNTFAYETTFSAAVNFGNYIRLSPLSSAPAYQSGYALIYLLNGGSNAYQLRAKIRSPDGTKFIDYQITTT
jgi:hypothetical protein